MKKKLITCGPAGEATEGQSAYSALHDGCLEIKGERVSAELPHTGEVAIALLRLEGGAVNLHSVMDKSTDDDDFIDPAASVQNRLDTQREHCEGRCFRWILRLFDILRAIRHGLS